MTTSTDTGKLARFIGETPWMNGEDAEELARKYADNG